MTIRDDVMATAALMAHTIPEHGSLEHAVVERLVEQGYSRIRAEVLVIFVPLGLCRAVIAELHARPPIVLPEIAMIHDHARDRTLKVRLTDVPEFVAALELGEESSVTRCDSERTLPSMWYQRGTQFGQ